VAVFSRSEDRAFVLGGYDASTGELLHDLWMRPVEEPGAWHRIELHHVDLGRGVGSEAQLEAARSFDVGHVLAATWSYLDHRLWVLDDVPGDSEGASVARLYRVEPYLGAVQLVGAWRRDPARDRVFLVLDRDGAVLLVTSSTAGAVHSVVRLEATPYAPQTPLRISLTHSPGALVLPPFADAAGYSFALQRGSGIGVRHPLQGSEGMVELERRTELGLLTGTLDEVGSVL
jgi:hypothetical protein